jgi:hypothetical protein
LWRVYVRTIVVLLVFSEDKSRWETGLMIVATAVIALGVWGEILFSRKAEEAGDELQRVSDEKVAEALERAATLEKEAADARGRTADIERLTAWRHARSAANPTFGAHPAIHQPGAARSCPATF